MPRTSTSHVRALVCSVASTASLIIVGCASLPRAPATPSADDGFRPVINVDPEGMDPEEPQALTLVPGDVVSLRITSAETEEVEGLTVDARGMLHVPLAGDVDVRGLSLQEAEARVEEAFHRYDAAARVTIVLSDPQGHTASVIGAVGEQGRVSLVPGMRVTDLLAAAGGALRAEEEGVGGGITADLHAARLIRDGEALPISLALAVQGDPRHNVYVQPGDHLYVPPQLGQLISVLGEVNDARVLPYQPGLRLSQILALAGGITRDANGGDIRIVRGPSTRHPTVYRAAIDHIVSGDHPDPVIAPGDIIYVGSSALADFNEVMTVITPIISAGLTGALIGVSLER